MFEASVMLNCRCSGRRIGCGEGDGAGSGGLVLGTGFGDGLSLDDGATVLVLVVVDEVGSAANTQLLIRTVEKEEGRRSELD